MIKRRKFLQFSGGFLLATATAGCFTPQIATSLRNPVTVYVFQGENPTYFRRSFELAEEFLKEEIGLNVRFVYFSQGNLELKALDARNRLAIVETEAEVLVQKSFEEIRIKDKEVKDIRDIKSLLEGQIEKHGFKGTEYQTSPYLNLSTYRGMKIEDAVKRFNEFLLKMQRNYYSLNYGETDLDERVAYLTKGRSFNFKSVKIDNNTSRMFRTDKLTQIRLQAKTIVHEFSHLTGLWHTDQFKNDGIDDYLENVPNAMVKDGDLVGDGKYGFIMTETQKRWIRDFFDGKDSFAMYQSAVNEKGKHNADALSRKLAERFGYK